MVTRTIDIQTTDPSLSDLLAQVREGVLIVFTEGDKPVARLVPA